MTRHPGMRCGPVPRRVQPGRLLMREICAELVHRLPPDAVVWHTPNEDTSGSFASVLERERDFVVAGIPDIFILFRGALYGTDPQA